MLRQAFNNVHIIGRLNEINLTERDSAKDNRHYVSGEVTFLVDQAIGGIDETEVIPVRVFAFEKKSNGDSNPSFTNIKDLMTHGISVAATGDATKADVYECNCRVQENNFLGRDGVMVSSNQISSGFFTKRSTTAVEEEATFEQEVVIAQVFDETRNDEPTGRLVIDGLVVQWNGAPDKIRYVVESPDAISYIEQNWEAENTVKLSGKIRYGSEKVELEIADSTAFGEAPTRVRTHTIHDFVVTAGSSPYDEDMAYNCEEVATALAERKANTERRLKEQKSSDNSGASATPATPKASRLSRGF